MKTPAVRQGLFTEQHEDKHRSFKQELKFAEPLIPRLHLLN